MFNIIMHRRIFHVYYVFALVIFRFNIIDSSSVRRTFAKNLYDRHSAFILPNQPIKVLPTSTTTSTFLRREQTIQNNKYVLVLFGSSKNNNKNSINPNDYETPEERDARMKLVQQIQQTFYKDEYQTLNQQQQQQNTDIESFNDNSKSKNEDSNVIIQNVPLWRVQWTELPGYQQVLNCHVPHYTHMFRRILSGPKPWYFGHAYLPNGSENLSNPLYKLEWDDDDMNGNNTDPIDEPSLENEKSNKKSLATRIGTLMQISDYKILNDGRLILIVQGIERFYIMNAKQHIPYAIADIKLLFDKETLQQKQQPTWEDWKEYEYYPTMFNDCIINDDESNSVIAVSPLANYNKNWLMNKNARKTDNNVNVRPKEIQITNIEPLISSFAEVSTTSTATTTLANNNKITNLEYYLWIGIDEYICLLKQAVRPGVQVPIPSQLIGLLPSNQIWPENFQLESFARQLEDGPSNNIGTASMSPFVRVVCQEEDMDTTPKYPLLLRASRLSYVVWIVLWSDHITLIDTPTRQQILEEISIEKRLLMALQYIERISDLIRRAIDK